MTIPSQNPLLHGVELASDCMVNVFAIAPVALLSTTTVEEA